MDSAENVTTGQRLRQIRTARRKSLRVVAGLAGISKSKLSRIERGECALDSRSETVALANVLQISSSELIGEPDAAPGDGRTKIAVQAVRGALLAATHHHPGGQVLPVEALRARVTATVAAHCRCDRDDEVGVALPVLIRDLHASIAAGRDVAELLDLAVLLHTEATLGWLRVAGAPLDLRSQAAMLAREVAQERGTPTAMALGVWGGVHVLVTADALDLAQAELDAVSVPMTSPESMQLVGMMSMCKSLVAAADKRFGDVDAPLDYAAELAERSGEGNAFWMGFGPTNVGCWRMHAAVELGDHEGAVAVAEGIQYIRVPSACRSIKPTTGPTTVVRWPECGIGATTLRWHCAALSASPRGIYSGIRSRGRRSVSWWRAPSGTQWVGSCGGWRTGRACPSRSAKQTSFSGCE